MHSSSTPAPQLGRAFSDGTLGLVALAILLASAVVWSSHSVNAERTDFALTYVGAHIVHEGSGRQLYDLGLQVRLRESMFQHASPLYFEHPPFEALALSRLAGFSFRTAYLVWGLVNVAVLLVLIVWLQPYFSWPAEDLGYISLWLLFAPLGVSLYQGQSSIFVLAAYAFAFVQLKKENPLSAGIALGLALVKFQFAVPFAVIFLLRRQWRFLGGFAASAAVLGLFSIVAVGWGGVLDYIRLLLRIGNNPQNLSYGSAVDMPTLHGLVYAAAGHHLNVVGLNTVVSLLTLLGVPTLFPVRELALSLPHGDYSDHIRLGLRARCKAHSSIERRRRSHGGGGIADAYDHSNNEIAPGDGGKISERSGSGRTGN